MKNILIINHKFKNCGVYQYGLRTANILKKSQKYNFIHVEVENLFEYDNAINLYNPFAIIYNNHLHIMPWLSFNVINQYKNIIHIGIIHEGDGYKHYNYDYAIDQDSTSPDRHNIFSVPRPLIKHKNNIIEPNILTINSFGFGFSDKGFDRIINLVQSQYDAAIINLHITHAHYGVPKQEILNLCDYCHSQIKNKNIILNITNNFLNEDDLLKFLSSSTINVFLYNGDTHTNRGLSSVIDYALSVDKPIAISNSNMFRHLANITPSICVNNRSLLDIINSGTKPLEEIKQKFSSNEFIKKYEYIIDEIKK